MAVSLASMTAQLVTKLSLKDGEELVDLRNLHRSGKGFLAPQFFLIGRLNSAHAMILDSFRSAIRSMWRLLVPVDVQAHGDCFLFTFANERDLGRVKKRQSMGFSEGNDHLNDYDGFSDIVAIPLDFMWIWEEILGLPPGLMITPIARLIDKTIGLVLQVDNPGILRGIAWVWVTIPLNDPVYLKWPIRFSPIDMFTLSIQYERLRGRYQDCSMINHCGASCPHEHEVEDIAVTGGLGVPDWRPLP
ncbi:uncharacterized protein LOC133731221 [Rosa rugosa]|uniref:uncharacterized protein LOC133731221 n=1 Tax=Rosa rugosa TaxID=74645 RepID=UPI002B405964|nr:uncharacterized protein LOC133731221 [Rosa rugosa]